MPTKRSWVSVVPEFIRRHSSILVIALFIPMAIAYWRFKVDDAYISFVYAKNLIQGHGLTYNGAVVEGYSNFLWTVIIAPFIWLGWDPLLIARIFGIASASLAVFFAEKILITVEPEISAWGRFLSLAVVALSAPMAAWAVGGLETVFMSLWVTLFVY